jgi:hypothetical protein
MKRFTTPRGEFAPRVMHAEEEIMPKQETKALVSCFVSQPLAAWQFPPPREQETMEMGVSGAPPRGQEDA